jgi:undecaprenyl-diphosphatase
MPVPTPLLTRLRRHPGDSLLLVIGGIGVLLGLFIQSWRGLNISLFLEINHWGAFAPTLWSALCVVGLGVSAFVLVGALGPKSAREMAALVGLLILGTLVTQGLKFALQSPRPLAELGLGLVEVIGEPLRTRSMPSGHSFTAFSVLAVIWLGGPRRIGRFALLALLAIAVGVARVAVGAHWPSDVIVGAGLGLVVATLTWHLAPVRRLAALLPGVAGRRILALALGLSAAWLLLSALEGGAGILGVKPTGYPLARQLQTAVALIGFWGAWRWSREAQTLLPAWDFPQLIFETASHQRDGEAEAVAAWAAQRDGAPSTEWPNTAPSVTDTGERRSTTAAELARVAASTDGGTDLVPRQPVDRDAYRPPPAPSELAQVEAPRPADAAAAGPEPEPEPAPPRHDRSRYARPDIDPAAATQRPAESQPGRGS